LEMNSNLINYLHPKKDVDKNEMLNASSVSTSIIRSFRMDNEIFKNGSG